MGSRKWANGGGGWPVGKSFENPIRKNPILCCLGTYVATFELATLEHILPWNICYHDNDKLLLNMFFSVKYFLNNMRI